MRRFSFLTRYKPLLYFSFIVIANNLWFLDPPGSWFITLGIILTMPFLGLDFLISLMLVLEDSMFKALFFLIDPSTMGYFPFYLGSAVAYICILSYINLRSRSERYDLLSTLHRLKNESLDIESGMEEKFKEISKEGKKQSFIKGMIQEREESYKNMLNIIKRSLHPFTVILYFKSAEDTFYPREFISGSEQLNTRPISASEGILHAVVRERRSLIVQKFFGSKNVIPYYSKKEEVQSLIALPIISGKRFKGILCLDSLEPERFSARDEDILKNFCNEITKIIDSSEAMKTFEKIREELYNLSELGTRLNKSPTEEEAVDVLVDIAEKFVGMDFYSYVSHESSTGKNRIIRISDEEATKFLGREFSCDEKLGLVSWVIKNGVPLEYSKIMEKGKEIVLYNKSLKLEFKYDSLAIMPVRSKDRVLGAFVIASHRDHLCREEDKYLLQGITAQIGISIENARMYEALKHLATVDGLTGLCNHRTFQERLSLEIDRYNRNKETFSLLLMDIDHFKLFNDKYGHPIGDFVLKEISNVLQSMARKIDLAARYGGEEFALILLGTDMPGAVKMAERIRKKVEESLFVKDELSLKVTLSIGISTYSESETKQSLIESADKALYEAKALGRNRAVHFESIRAKTALSPEYSA